VIPAIGPVSRKAADSVVLAVVLYMVAGRREIIIPGRPMTISRVGTRFTDFPAESRLLVDKNSIERLIECQEDNAVRAEKGAAVGKKDLSFPVSRDTIRKIRKGP